ERLGRHAHDHVVGLAGQHPLAGEADLGPDLHEQVLEARVVGEVLVADVDAGEVGGHPGHGHRVEVGLDDGVGGGGDDAGLAAAAGGVGHTGSPTSTVLGRRAGARVREAAISRASCAEVLRDCSSHWYATVSCLAEPRSGTSDVTSTRPRTYSET